LSQSLAVATPAALDHEPERARPPRGSFGVVNFFSQGFLLVWAAMVVLPLLWAVLSSFKTDAEILSSPWSLPTTPHWDNFPRAWTNGHIGTFFLNTIIVLLGGVLITMLVGAMAAYVLARYSFPGNRVIYYAFVAGLTLPIFLALVPLYKIVGNLGDIPGIGPYIGLNSYAGLILVYVAYSLPFTVFFLHSFFRTLPTEVAEAGMLDGASDTGLFLRVMMPMAKPGLISIGIFNVIGQWNQYLLPLVLMQAQSSYDTDHSVLAQGLLNLAVAQGYKSDWSGLFAGMTIAMLPMLAIYVVFQRQVQAGLTAGTLK
jgi:N-acetylglucosamine transport system permease protein